jgi:acyl transferase domain-containing protein/thioesterase domain-containing protein/acyl carrier protein
MNASPIAIIGMAGRFPGARNVAEFWRNLRDGVESICDRSDAALAASGATPEELANPDYVKRASVLDDVPAFDASFFGLSPRDASIMDPQHRHFLECAWEALEDAGHPPRQFDGSVGVFAGSGMNTYLIHNLLANRRLVETAGLFQLKQTGNDKDVLATRVSYQFDLRGPSVNVQTACSTSLVAVHLACQSLLNYECDIALAGGVTIEIPCGLGYIYREGEILSRDGHCRPFDVGSSGTVFASGLGIVVLRRLDDALREHDQMRAVILGSAINNDGARKVGYLAPSIDGQAEVIAEALSFAGINAEDISYIETHGTGTIVGDPIEVRALTKAFRATTTKVGYCGIGSLKSNLGHLDAAAGVAGLIKTVLALEHSQLPPSLHFKRLNPHIELEGSPFYVNNKLANWAAKGSTLRAGVTSLGIGGTNAHVVLERAPEAKLSRRLTPYHLLTISAKSESAVERASNNLANHLVAHPELNLGDVAFTCQLGRQGFPHRRAVVVQDVSGAAEALANTHQKEIASGIVQGSAPQIAFMFSGQGAQYVNMGRELYEHVPVFRATLDDCAHELQKPLGIDLLQALYPPQPDAGSDSEKLNQTWLTQPALFSIEYALARWWMSLGVQPAAMVGHSIGEYVAACLAGVFSLADALAIVALRGRLIYSLSGGSMLAIPLPASEIRCPGSLSLAAVNSPNLCVVSGPTPEIEALEADLAKQLVACRRLHTSHAFHSAMMDPILGEFEQQLRSFSFKPPETPFTSNVTGTWIKPEEATDPGYWARHIRQTVQFSECLATLTRNADQILIEVGPGNTLTSLARQQGDKSMRAHQSLPHPREATSALRCALTTLGRLWTQGVEIDWAALFPEDSVRRVSLPTYPFEHQNFWIEPDRPHHVEPDHSNHADAHVVSLTEKAEEEIDTWFYKRVWKPAPLVPGANRGAGCWIIFRDSLGLGDHIASKLQSEKQEVVIVNSGAEFRRIERNIYSVRPGVREDYDALVSRLSKEGLAPRKIIHLWSVVASEGDVPLDETLDSSFYSPLFLAQALGVQDIAALDLAIVSNCLQQVGDEPIHHPARAVLLGPARVTPKELSGIACRSIDVDLDSGRIQDYATRVVAEMNSTGENGAVAYRGAQRYTETIDRLDLAAAPKRNALENGGVYLITGGFGGIGLVVAEDLAREFKAHLILVGRSPLRPEAMWEASLNDSSVPESDKDKLRKLIQIRSEAGGLLIAQADVSDLSEMRNVIALAIKRFGKIDGVFHAAGILDDGPLMLKSREATARVLLPKVCGTLVLESVLRDAPLKCFVLFSSISSIFPPPGQVDYAAANAFLDAFALSRKGPVTAINWSAWRDVGMAARGSTQHPLIHRRPIETLQAIVCAGDFSISQQWLLSEHRFKSGKALVPGTGYLEMAAAAFSRTARRRAVELRDVFFLAPLTFDANAQKEVFVQLTREQTDGVDDGTYRFSILVHENGWVEHCTGSIAASSARPVAPVERIKLAARCQKQLIIFDDQHRTRQEKYFDFGPRWHCLRRLQIGEREGLAELELDPAYEQDTTSFLMHPALLDLATGCSLYLTAGYESAADLYLPLSYKRICVYDALPRKVFSHIRARRENAVHGEVESFDITLLNEHNQVLAEIEGFAMRRIEDSETLKDEKLAPSRIADPEGLKLITLLSHSRIPPLQGSHSLKRILLGKTPPSVIVAPQRPEDLTLQILKETPQILSSRLAEEDIESTLAGWWRDLLGVDKVDPDDDFFDLGGHSLIGVRLFAKIKKTYQVDNELAILFVARTVRQLADVIRKSRGEVVLERRNWSCLVPIQPNGTKVPFFCVHHIGGHALSYEALARALGPDQPLYAFQSPLVSGAEIRDISITEMASTYVKELRAFLPQGPYLVGGISFGGLIAFEMFQQLNAQGADSGLLVLFDTSLPGSEDRVGLVDQISTFRHNVKTEGKVYLRRKLKEQQKHWGDWLLRRFNHSAGYFYSLVGRELPPDVRYAQVEKMHWRALLHFTFKTYPGKIILLRATDRSPENLGLREDPALGWGRLAGGGLEIHNVVSGHDNMLLEPQVNRVADELKLIFSRLEAAARVPA